MDSLISSSDAPSRRRPPSDTSTSEKRQGRILPLAVKRIREHRSQNDSVSDAIKPTFPPVPESVNVCAPCPLFGLSAVISNSRNTTFFTSEICSTKSGSHPSPQSGINSKNLTSKNRKS